MIIAPTSGPWEVDKIGCWVRVANDHSFRVADMRGWSHLRAHQRMTSHAAFNIQLANAHLIAVAPEMMSYIMGRISKVPINSPEWLEIDAIIKKATHDDD